MIKKLTTVALAALFAGQVAAGTVLACEGNTCPGGSSNTNQNVNQNGNSNTNNNGNSNTNNNTANGGNGTGIGIGTGGQGGAGGAGGSANSNSSANNQLANNLSNIGNTENKSLTMGDQNAAISGCMGSYGLQIGLIGTDAIGIGGHNTRYITKCGEVQTGQKLLKLGFDKANDDAASIGIETLRAALPAVDEAVTKMQDKDKKAFSFNLSK